MPWTIDEALRDDAIERTKGSVSRLDGLLPEPQFQEQKI